MKLRKRGRRNETTANSGERESQKVSRRRMSRIRNRHGKEKDEVSVLTFVCLLQILRQYVFDVSGFFVGANTTEVEDLLVVRDAQQNAADVYGKCFEFFCFICVFVEKKKTYLCLLSKPPMVAEFQPSR